MNEFKRNIVVGLGEVLWDMLPDGRKPGGAPANFAYHCSQFGNKGVVVSAIGNDSDGLEIANVLVGKGLDVNMATVDYPTGEVRVVVDDKGIPNYDFLENSAWDNIPFTPEMAALAGKADAVCFGTLAQRSHASRDSILKFIDTVPDDALKIFDINIRAPYYCKGVIIDSLERCNVLKINDEEIPVLCEAIGLRNNGLKELCGCVIGKFGLRYMIVTCGIAGSYSVSVDGIHFEPTKKVDVKDTVGAGDSFTAAFCSALLAGRSMIEAHRLAVAVSAYVCTCVGAMPELPDTLTSAINVAE